MKIKRFLALKGISIGEIKKKTALYIMIKDVPFKSKWLFF